MRTCRTCGSGPHHGPCNSFNYAVVMVLMVVIAILVSSFIADFYVYIGLMKGPE